MVETYIPPGEDDPSVPPENSLLFEEVVGIILFVSASVLAGLQVFLRAALNIGLVWGQEFVVILVVWSVFIGASAVTARRRHVRMDLIATSLPARPGALLETMASVATLVYIGFVLVAACAFQYFLYNSNEVDPSTDLPTWWLFLGLPIGAALMVFRAGRDLRARFLTYRHTL